MTAWNHAKSLHLLRRWWKRFFKFRGRMATGVNFLKLFDADLRVNRGRVEFFVSQQLLDKPDVRPVFQHVRRAGVPQDVAAAFALQPNPNNATALDNAPEFATQGALAYQANHCGACHLANGLGMKIGPPLNGLSKRRSRSWVEEHFSDPQKLSPGSIMPPFRLSPQDMQNLTTYLFALPE